MPKRLILFDIDGTLIASNFAGRQVLSRALREVFGTDGALDGYSFAGKTDLGIITDLLTGAGLDLDEISARLPSLYDAMARYGELLFAGDDLVLCPGIEELLMALRASPAVMIGLQTGNIRPTAIQKLRIVGLQPEWFPIGGYGSDSPGRDGLLPAAWRRARKLTGCTFAGHNTIVIGDTPGDIHSARANGALAVAVASGIYDKSALASHRPDYLFSDLTDTGQVLRILTRQDHR